MKNPVKVKGWIKSWLVNRYPAQQNICLTQNRIYILPTLAGSAYLIVILLILLLSVNYQNNLTYAVCFTLLSVFITTILHTYANLSGLQTTALLTEPVFVDETARFRYQLTTKRAMFQLNLGFEKEKVTTFDLAANRPVNVEIPFRCSRRGWQRPSLLHISTLYPLGLFRAWSWLLFDQSVLVYPKPMAGGNITSLRGGDQYNNTVGAQGDDEFQALKSYYPGATKSSIAWKIYAKGYGLQVKEHQDYAGDELWLDWSFWPELTIEERLSRLCYWALLLSDRGAFFGLRLPGKKINPATGEKHKFNVLKQLALFDGGRSEDV